MVTASADVGSGMAFRALRGATTAAADEPGEVAVAVRELVQAISDANGLHPSQILSAIFSATPDVRSLYPAAVAREMGWQDVPMLCVSEMDVVQAPVRCIRVLLHLSVEPHQRLRPIYLRGATVLRPDLAEHP